MPHPLQMEEMSPMKAALELTPQLITTTQHLFQDYNKKRDTTWKEKQHPDNFKYISVLRRDTELKTSFCFAEYLQMIYRNF